MAKMTLDFAGMDTYLDELRKLGANVETEAEKALKESVEMMNQELHSEMKKHYVTGETEASLRENERVRKSGGKLSIKYGFNIKKGGEPAIYLEKGRPKHQEATPVHEPAKRRAERKYKQILEKALRKAMGD